jgi:hypothetical protein
MIDKKNPVEEQDSLNEDDEFDRILREQKFKPSSSNDMEENTSVEIDKSNNQ